LIDDAYVSDKRMASAMLTAVFPAGDVPVAGL
jgi:hypothetical protein